MKKYKINEVAQRLGLSAGTIRYYEEKGLLSVEKDKENGYRLFTEEDVYKLWSVAYHRSFQMSLKDIYTLKYSGDNLEDIRDTVRNQRQEALLSLAEAQRKLSILACYDAFIERASREGEPPCREKSEKLYFYPASDLYERTGASYPACTFGSLFDGGKEESFSVVYDSDLDFLPENGAERALFSVDSFDGVHVTVCIDCFLDGAAALEEAKKELLLPGIMWIIPVMCCICSLPVVLRMLCAIMMCG